MRRKYCLTLLLTALIIFLYAQSRSEGGVNYKGVSYDIFTVRIDSNALKQFSIIQNTAQVKHADFVSQTILNGDSDCLLINAGISGPGCVPEGLLISNGTELSPLNLKDGTANFYLKPNGVLLLTKTAAAIVESAKATDYKDIVWATQSGPLLVNNNRLHPKINAGSPNKNLRCGVGLYKKGNATWLIFATATQPVNFYDFACLFKEYYGCTDALCLESAGCAMYLPYINRVNSTDSFVICTYLMFRE